MTPLGILAATLERLGRDLEQSDRVTAQWREEFRRARELANGLDPYLSQCTTAESEALQELARRTQAEDWGGRSTGPGAPMLEQEMLSGHVEGQTLKFLVHMTGARRVLEIGMFTGYSALAMAEALPGDGELVACEIDEYVAGLARACFDRSASGHKIVIRVAPAAQTLHELAVAAESFDLVFIDADKGGYGAYLDLVLDTGLLAPGGVICVDNTLMQGEVYLNGEVSANGAAIARFNQKVADDPRLEQVLIPLRDGLSLIRRA